MLRPTLRAAKAVAVLDRAWDDEFLDGFLATEHWGNDNVSFPGACYARYIEELYRGNRLITGEFTVLGRPARLAAITLPGARDRVRRRHIVPLRERAAAGRPRQQHATSSSSSIAAATSAPSSRARQPSGCGRRCRRSGRSETEPPARATLRLP